MSTATGLRLSLSPRRNAALRRWLAAHGAGVVSAAAEHLTHIYFDTPKLDLARRGIRLSLRRRNGQWFQALRLGQPGAAEREFPVRGRALELERIDDRGARLFLRRKKIAAKLHPLFTSRYSRTRWTLQQAGAGRVELRLDHGKIAGGARSLPINEVALELQQGEPAALFDLAGALAACFPLLPQPQGKASRGYALYRGEVAAPVRAGAASLHPGMSPAQARRGVVAECLRQLQANLPGAQGCEEGEFVHQARVALRRLRAAQKAFGAQADDQEWQAMLPDIRWLAAGLGRLRDLEVLRQETLERIESAAGEVPGLDGLRQALRQRCDACRAQLRAALDSPRCGLLLVHLTAWLRRDAGEEGAEASLQVFAHQALQRQWRQLRRLARDWKSLSEPQRHELRKRAKTLRYALEFFSSLYDAGRVAEYLASLQEVQDILGRMNDGVAARQLLQQLPAADGELLQAVGFVNGWLAGSSQQSEARLARALGRLQRAGRFW